MNKLSAYSGKNKKAFSIMEVMISAFILSVGLTAVIALMAGNIKNSINARDSIIASELAQEGVELVRNIRDNNIANGRVSFDAGYFPPACSDDPLSFPYARIDFLDIYNEEGSYCYPANNGTSNKSLLKYSGSYYSHFLTGSTTKFARGIKIEDYGTDGKKVKSFVAWGGMNYRYADMFPSYILAYLPGENYEGDCTLANKCIMVEDILTDWAN